MTSTSLFLQLLVLIVGVFSARVIAQNQCNGFNGKLAQCVFIQYCPSLYPLTKKLSLTANDRAILLKSLCGGDGTAPKVCCEDFVHPIASQASNYGRQCNTPNNINGQCIELKACNPLNQLIKQRPLSAENRQFLAQSQCGVIGRQPLVCCPLTTATIGPTTPTTERTVLGKNDTNNGIAPSEDFGSSSIEDTIQEYQCRAISGKVGQCILLQYCPKLYAISRKSKLTVEDRNLLLGSQCDSEGTAPKVCCEDAVRPIISRTVTAGGRCTAPDNISGRCIELKTCESLGQRPQSVILQRYQCGRIGEEPLVCCPRTVATTTTTELPVPIIDTGDEVSPTSSLLPAYAECGSSSNDAKIVGGDKTTITEYPWMTLLKYERNFENEFSCGGTLISKRYVLTAAHCVKGAVLKEIGNLVRVRLGEYDILNKTDCQVNFGCSDPPQDIEVEEIIPHAGWIESNPSHHNDIALIRLKRDVNFSNFIKPICLPNKGIHIALADEETGEEILTVAGWGITESNKTSNVKLQLRIPLKPLSLCQNEYQRISINGDIDLKERTQFCAGGERKKDACGGDSGGPAMGLYIDELGRFVWFNTGIVSFGPKPCGQSGIPAVYTRTNEYIDWILYNMRP